MAGPYGPEVDDTAMRCPRCLDPWDPDWVDLDAEHAACRRCDLTVALLDHLVPEWTRDAVAARLDHVGPTPARYLAARFERVRRAHRETGAYR